MEIVLVYSVDCFRFCPVPMYSCSGVEEVACVLVWVEGSYPFHYIYFIIATINIPSSSTLKNVPYDALLIISLPLFLFSSPVAARLQTYTANT